MKTGSNRSCIVYHNFGNWEFTKNMLSNVTGQFGYDITTVTTRTIKENLVCPGSVDVISIQNGVDSHQQRMEVFEKLNWLVQETDFVFNLHQCNGSQFFMKNITIEMLKYLSTRYDAMYIQEWAMLCLIALCDKHKKPFIFYTFDHLLSKHSVCPKMHGYIDHESMFHLPLIEASAGQKAIGWQENKEFDFLYAGLLQFEHIISDGRVKLHRDIAAYTDSRDCIMMEMNFSELGQENMPCYFQNSIAVKDNFFQDKSGKTKYECNTIRTFLPEPEYFKAMQKSRFVIVPCNIWGDAVSTKRGIDAIANGALPVYPQPELAKSLDPQIYAPIIDAGLICEPSQFRFLRTTSNSYWQKVYAAQVAKFKEINVRKLLDDYCVEWSKDANGSFAAYFKNINAY